MTKYRVSTNHCKCHPETCPHWDYYLEETVNGVWRKMQGSDSFNELDELKVSLENTELASHNAETVKIKTKYGETITYTDNQDVRNAVFERVMEYFVKHGMFSGEGIQQSDNAILDAPEVMSDIADDIIKFKSEYEE